MNLRDNFLLPETIEIAGIGNQWIWSVSLNNLQKRLMVPFENVLYDD